MNGRSSFCTNARRAIRACRPSSAHRVGTVPSIKTSHGSQTMTQGSPLPSASLRKKPPSTSTLRHAPNTGERARFNRGGLPLRTPEFLPTRRISTPPTRFGILYRIGCFSAPAQPIASLPHPVRTMRNNIRHRRINPNRNRTTSPPHIARKRSGEFIPTPLPYAHSKLRNTEGSEMRRLYVGGSGVPGFRSRDSKGPGVGVPGSPPSSYRSGPMPGPAARTPVKKYLSGKIHSNQSPEIDPIRRPQKKLCRKTNYDTASSV